MASRTPLVLAGDVGGTNARFALFPAKGSRAVHAVYQQVLSSRSASSFEAVLARFLDGARAKLGAVDVRAAAFGIAGPVVDQRVRTTNLPWVIDARLLAKRFRVPHVTLLNDLVAAGLGALAAPPSKIAVVHLGRPAKQGANVAVIAAGTGLGEAAFVWDGARHVPLATEGSHVEFAPRTQLEWDLAQELAREHGHVSYERVASGATIAMLHAFVLRAEGIRESKAALAEIAAAPDPNAAVVELATSGRSRAARRAVDLWCSVYGAEAGNLALKTLASGGVYLCGGVSARLAKVLAEGLDGGRKARGPSPFLAAFFDKGRMRPLVEAIPVAVCLEPLAGLRGAAAHAAGDAARAP
jgi:glucokinase